MSWSVKWPQSLKGGDENFKDFKPVLSRTLPWIVFEPPPPKRPNQQDTRHFYPKCQSVIQASSSFSSLTVLKLILVTGYPSSGKTYRSNQLISYLSSKIANAPSSSSHSRLRIEHISDQTLHIQRSAYESAKSEKDARASLASAVKRALGPDTIVIADAPNYIKGFRYQLYCEAKAARTPSCVVRY